jgi:hypothetical protein
VNDEEGDALAELFAGTWRIVDAELWDQEALELGGPATIRIDGATGTLRLGTLEATLDLRYDVREAGPVAEFSFEGFDEGEQAIGRGWLQPLDTGGLEGHLFFHFGEDSPITCAAMDEPDQWQKPLRPPPHAL